ncbi:MAG: hypothetical protein R3236_08400, partial [Phycisphaeraceae bacterium]|nr:hypothetical protein [Phycisphaeraceae bacterium]
MRNRLTSICLAMALALAATIGWSQSRNDPPVDLPAAEKKQSQTKADPTQSASVVSPDDPRLRKLPLKREGAYVLNKPARFATAAAAGQQILWSKQLIFDDPQLRPMILMPCQLLEDMEKIHKEQTAAGRTVKFQVSGQVFIYHNQNYLLPTL